MSAASRGLLAGVEAGGTKFVCGVAREDGAIVDQLRIPTTTPEETLGAALSFFNAASLRHGPLAALAIASFGPLSLDPSAPDYGSVTVTPKPGWSGTGLVRFFEPLGVPVLLDTDVNGSAIGELLSGSARGLDSFCYVTVGTGIGVSVVIDGAPHGGANHPEGGHIRVPRASGDDAFAGICPFHGDCLEGLACGPAIKTRWGVRPPDLPEDHPAWAIEADYLASLCANLTYLVRPQRIILGGGVMQKPHLFDLIRKALAEKLGGYDSSVRRLDMLSYIVAPTAGASAGLVGALATAYRHMSGEWPSDWGGSGMRPMHQAGEPFYRDRQPPTTPDRTSKKFGVC